MAVKVFNAIVVFIFIVSPLAVFLLRPDFGFYFEALLLSYVITLYCVGPYLLFCLTHKASSITVVNIDSTFILAIVPLMAVVVVQLLLLDVGELRISRETERSVSRVSVLLVNLNVPMTALAIIYYFRRGSRFSLVLLCICFALSFGVAFFEGRRAIIVILVGLAGLLSLSNSKSRREFVVRCCVFTSVLILFLSVITLARTSGSVEGLFGIFRAILTRVLNPGWMILHVVDNNHVDHVPEIGRTVLDRIQYVFGKEQDYTGAGNAFGRDYGLLSSSNSVVGINPGVLVEAYLWSPWLAPLLVTVLLLISRFIIRLWACFSPSLGFLIAILCAHGFQMEIGYTVGLLLRLFAVGAVVLLLVSALPRKPYARHL